VGEGAIRVTTLDINFAFFRLSVKIASSYSQKE